MPRMSDMKGTPRRALHVFYVLDTSRSMEGRRIAALNKAMEETTAILSQQAQRNADAQVKIAVLEFNSGCQWLQPKGPENMEDFIWSSRTAGGLTDIGHAIEELNDKLSRKAFLSSDTGAYVPIIIFMTDGYATDNYKKALEQIRRNKWFAYAIKIGFALGDAADTEMITEIVGHSEAVVKTQDLAVFTRLLRFVSLTSTLLGSQSRTETEELSGRMIVKQALKDGMIQEEDVDWDKSGSKKSQDVETEYAVDIDDMEEWDWDD